MTTIHPSSVIHPSAQLDESVTVGPFCIIEEGVKIGAGTQLIQGVHAGKGAEIGRDNIIYGPTTIGLPPQDLRFKGEETRCVIGDHNVIREFVTIHRGTGHGGGLTSVGSHGLYMAYSHIAHDCHVGDHVIFANAGTLAGHVTVGDHATIGAFCAVHQFCRVGAYAYLGGFTVATQDVLPYCKTVGSRPARVYGINTIGLQRKGFSEDAIAALKRTFRLLFLTKRSLGEALPEVEAEMGKNPDAAVLIDFVRTSERGVIAR
ncbi:MAG TPA: acyl-ACP--UDP-N-acetylglucosamine O-acyltransferase [Thermoanaerobaculia bacterium]|nr:acyl-ACP--UDP-N-acetylglucosamine O-acyltransferase [Thermoanaerobaculia bacterium]HUM29715.1 acyl-ACP--UDP-N-acetylglucosamine O-acyltransferase [Thermoanaerobaculia bacterium]HXK67015.1 acyl-ACP--UDP-N-acetylglucosamine O-acyltransferase [Thermoanaerobaculia bacterium]